MNTTPERFTTTTAVVFMPVRGVMFYLRSRMDVGTLEKYKLYGEYTLSPSTERHRKLKLDCISFVYTQ